MNGTYNKVLVSINQPTNKSLNVCLKQLKGKVGRRRKDLMPFSGQLHDFKGSI